MVAGEVKTLANQTPKVTDDIRQQIAVLGQTTSQSAESLRETASREINNFLSRIRAA